jgi:hypothetical protein
MSLSTKLKKRAITIMIALAQIIAAVAVGFLLLLRF